MKVEYIDHYLDDKAVADFARHSFLKRADQYTDEQNVSLIKYLARGVPTGEFTKAVEQARAGFLNEKDAELFIKHWRNMPRHWLPFAHPHITLRCSAPVPIRTQCYKTKIGMVESEESKRYVTSEPIVYIPDTFRVAADNVKQGSGGVHPDTETIRHIYEKAVNDALNTYTLLINNNVCPEQARFVLPQAAEVNWVWTGSLYAYANFYIQRSDSHAQKEIQIVAKMVDEIVRPLYPVSWSALVD